MLSAILGIAAFALYFLYDINSFRWKLRIPHTFFTVGTLLLGAATVLGLWEAYQEGFLSAAEDIILLICGAVCLLALIYCLFFALPFKQTYREQSDPHKVCRSGAYALCRHPGILCFFGVYLFLGAAAFPGNLAINGAVFSLLNLAYAWFQDRITFPKTFSDYDSYRESVPFLIPTKASIQMARRTLTKEDDA